MYDSYKIMEHLEKEVDKKAETGIRSTTDLDTVVKLSEAMKNFAKAEYYCTVTEAMEQGGYSQDDGYSQGGYSERRKSDSMGRYSRNGGYSRHDGYDNGSSYGHGGAYDRYMDAKHSYRSSRAPEHKKKMSEFLGEYKGELEEMMQSLLAGADTREEREEIKRMIREIGNIA